MRIFWVKQHMQRFNSYEHSCLLCFLRLEKVKTKFSDLCNFPNFCNNFQKCLSVRTPLEYIYYIYLEQMAPMARVKKILKVSKNTIRRNTDIYELERNVILNQTVGICTHTFFNFPTIWRHWLYANTQINIYACLYVL